MAKPANVEGSMDCLRSNIRRKLVDVLEMAPGRKDLVLDPSLMKALDRIAGISLLREQGVDKIFKLEKVAPPLNAEVRLYFVSSSLITAKYFCDHVTSEIRDGKSVKYHLILVPRKLHAIVQLLEEEGVYEFVHVHEFSLELIPLDSDLLSLELNNFFHNFFLDGEYSYLQTAVKALYTLQCEFGLIPNVLGQGRSPVIIDKLHKLFCEEFGSPPEQHPYFGYCFIFDRDVDYVTPLLSQLTYEGMLDEVFGIKCSMIEFGKEITGKDQTLKLLLTESDDVFSQIRDKHISTVFKYMVSEVKKLQEQHSKRQTMSINEMKSFISHDLKSVQTRHKSLSIHLSACEHIIEKKSKDIEEQMKTEHSMIANIDPKKSLGYIEDCMAQQLPLSSSLRLLSLFSYTQDGLSRKDYRSLKTQFLQSYGHEHLSTFLNLKKLGLFMEQDATPNVPLSTSSLPISFLPKRNNFKSIVKKFNLIPNADENYDLKNPTDLGFVFNGAYVPVICRIVQEVISRGSPTHLDDVLKLLPGQTLKKWQNSPPPRKNVLVYMLGGVTYAEIAAFRLLGALTSHRIVIATTSIINGNSLVNSTHSCL